MNTKTETPVASRTAQIRLLAKSDPQQAVLELKRFIDDTFQLEASNVEINYDQYSLNSLNGFFDAGNDSYFFKFHQEDGEEDMQGEYYRADLLAKADLPVDLPVWKSSLPGEQILVYRRREDKRFSDMLRELDVTPDASAISKAGMAERELNDKILSVAKSTLHEVSASQVKKEPFHHLFYERMIDLKTGQSPGGRYQDFYVGKQFDFPGCSLSWEEFSQAALILNGQKMLHTFGQIFSNAVVRLNPQNLTGAGGITAHGDAHNANVWFVDKGRDASLSYFDPAFAGNHIPSLMAEVKATFHNVFAHPFWLYDPEVTRSQFDVDVAFSNGELSISSDWHLSDVRRELLEAKMDTFWKPFLSHLSEQDLLPHDWEETIRCAFAMCPTLVMNLRAGADRHNESSSAIGFLVAGLAGSKPESGENVFTGFFDFIDPAPNR